MKPLSGELKTPITQKGAYYTWKTKTLKRMRKTMSMHLLH